MTMKTYDIGNFLSYHTLKYCAENGPSVPLSEIISHLEKNVINQIDSIDEYSNKYDGHTDPKWVTIMKFSLIDFDKAGWFKKAFPKRGQWTITDEGVIALDKYKDWRELSGEANARYREWKTQQVAEIAPIEQQPDLEIDLSTPKLSIDDLIETADLEIRNQLKKLDPYQFQDIVATLLRAMGYFIDFVAPRGKDGGVDLVCYQDPMGIKIPRVKVQIKHQPESSVSRPMISEFADVVRNKDEMGIYVTSGRFSRDARQHAIQHEKHIRLVDGDEFVELYKEFYPKLAGTDEADLLPLTMVWWAG